MIDYKLVFILFNLFSNKLIFKSKTMNSIKKDCLTIRVFYVENKVINTIYFSRALKKPKGIYKTTFRFYLEYF